MANQNLPPLQKLIAVTFAIMVLASFCFIGYRIITKSEYESKELKQANILAVSIIKTLAEQTRKDSAVWDKFHSDDIFLIIDHRTMPGNWVLKAAIKKNVDFVDIASTVDSGWNSRSPKSAAVSAKVYKDGRVIYNDAPASEVAEILHSDRTYEKKFFVIFRFPDESTSIPVKIRAAVFKYKDSENTNFISLTLAD